MVARSSLTIVAGVHAMKRSKRTKPARSQAQQPRPGGGDSPAEVLTVRYQTGMLRRVADTESVAVRMFSAPVIPSAILAAIAEERADTLGGVHGDPSLGKPIQYDRLVIDHPEHRTDIRVYNRAIQLFAGDSETIRRIHRLCEVVRKACDGPG
jgi:hypothetical protein